MKIHLYGITRMRDGKREWYAPEWGWQRRVAADHDTAADAQEDIYFRTNPYYGYDDEDMAEWNGATVVEFTADIPDPMTEVDEIEETLRRR